MFSLGDHSDQTDPPARQAAVEVDNEIIRVQAGHLDGAVWADLLELGLGPQAAQGHLRVTECIGGPYRDAHVEDAAARDVVKPQAVLMRLCNRDKIQVAHVLGRFH